METPVLLLRPIKTSLIEAACTEIRLELVDSMEPLSRVTTVTWTTYKSSKLTLEGLELGTRTLETLATRWLGKAQTSDDSSKPQA